MLVVGNLDKQPNNFVAHSEFGQRPLPLMGSALSFALSLQQRLQVIADANVNWKAGVMGVSTGVYLLETYLTCVAGFSLAH